MNEIRPRPAMEPLIAAVLRVRVGFPFDRSKAVRQRMLGLVKHDVVHARYGHHDHESVPVILNFASEFRSFTLQLSHRLRYVVAHEGDQMVPRRFVRLAIVDAMGRVYAHLTPPAPEDQPT